MHSTSKVRPFWLFIAVSKDHFKGQDVVLSGFSLSGQIITSVNVLTKMEAQGYVCKCEGELVLPAVPPVAALINNGNTAARLKCQLAAR